MSELATEIEAYLRTERRWVPARELCAHFGIRQRKLRGLRGVPGLCSEFAISGDKGYRHIAACTEAEWDRSQARLKDHAIGELQRIRRLRHRRAELLTTRITPPTLRDGQSLLFSAS